MKKGIEHDIHPDVATQTGKKVDQDGIPQLDQFLQNLAAQAPVVQDSFIKQIKTTLETADKFKSGLRDTIEQMQDGYSSVMNMYEMSFYLGIILIVSSLFLAILKGESLLPIVFGALGIADVIAFFIVEPPQKLQDSRANLAQLQAAYFSWFIDLCNWNSYLLQHDLKDQLDFQDFKEISEIVLQNTDRVMGLIEKYCETNKTET